ncbi:MAG TPA: GspE/PulE family protein [Polyangiales bacterium]|nr:GspE/PulE family protein [Polyangiales bacterium]
MNRPRSGAPEGTRNSDYNAQLVLDQCLDVANQYRASDIHIEPHADRLLFRLRIDGRLKVWKEFPIELQAQVVSRIKVLARLDISEKRLPQDGRFSVATPEGPREYRVATVPMLEGEKAVIRVLMQNLSKLDFKVVGYTDRNIRIYEELLAKPHGLLLHCGPAGSGKTTALYAAINHLRQDWRNIQTIEDPVEGRLEDVNQAQVNTEIGLTFAKLLRGFLRQDCDIILVGEIRDPETAQLAVQASLTGHLVLGTLHTNSAIGAVSRLVEMGAPSFLVGTGLIGAVSQRLVRRLCKTCRRAYQPTAEIAAQCGLRPEHQLYQAVGCDECGKLGFRGRIGIQEVLPIVPQLRDGICSNLSEPDLYKIAQQQGLVSMFRDGLSKAVNGLTTLEEVYQAVVADGV